MPSIADLARAGAETAATLGSGAVAQPLSGLAGLWALLTGQDDPAAAIARVQGGLTYQPSGKGAQNALQTIGDLAGYYERAKGAIADPVADALGPGMGAAMFTAPDAILSLLPFMKAGNLGGLKVGAAAQAGRVGEDALGPIPELATRYPETAMPISKLNEKGEYYAAKNLSPEERQVQKIRKAAQRDIDAGNTTPYFDASQRSNIPAGTYPETAGNTLNEAIPAGFDTFDNWAQTFNTPEVRARLNQAFDIGSQDPAAKDWYAMRQLYDEFVKRLGPEEGKAQFKARFADPMAATTGGADPTANLLTAAYGNFVKDTGDAFPRGRPNDKSPMGSVNSWELPHPVGGRYVGGNIDMFDQALLAGDKPLTAAGQPKRYNFSGNFLGRLDNATIDEQMMRLFDPAGKFKGAPPGDSYGVLESILADVARERGVSPMNFQDVAWLGAKRMNRDPLAVGKPMISHFNDMLERTSRVTGLPLDKVLDGFIRGNMPMYGLAGATVGTLAASPGGDE
jgi:hypothetical protein